MNEKDRNFDDLIDRFETRIYDTSKGEWRLKLMKQDLEAIAVNSPGLSIWDAGCGLAQLGLWLAGQGHSLTLCDISEKMLARAQKDFESNSLTAKFYHASIQHSVQKLPDFDVVLLHAVLEWLAAPLEGLRIVMDKVKSGGYLSLLFYNRNAMVYSNVLKGQWRLKPILEDSYLGKGSKLSPPNPQYPHEIEQVLVNAGFVIKIHTGIRVFHDYMADAVLANSDQQELFALEEKYCRMPVYRDMGRYVHLLAQKKAG